MASPTAREILDSALKRREELRLESEALDNLIGTYQNILGIGNPLRETFEEQPDLYRNLSKRALQSARVGEMIGAARRIIIGEGRPMKRGELVKRLEAAGFEIVGADKSKVFGTNLWRSGKFVPVAGKGYWPNDVALPSESVNRKS
jgi:hypothetical protein